MDLDAVKEASIEHLKDKWGEYAKITCPECGRSFEGSSTELVVNNYRNHRSTHNGKD